jgi:asparagine synthase (glutamine-hydrolysing)
MFAARDPYGIKPLYFADDGRAIRFASEVKALLAGGTVSAARDPAGVAGFFLTGSVPEPFTICRDVRAVEAGTSFHVEGERGRGDVRRHYSVARVFAEVDRRLPPAALTVPEVWLRDRLQASVEHHLVADVPVGLFLSAGIDSSALAVIATRVSRRPVHTFTLSFPEFQGSRADEAPPAERLARELNAPHTTRVVTREEFHADLPAILDRMDQPTIDGVNTWFISKAVREAGMKVAISGLGGDELFGSYPSFRTVPRLVRLARIPLAAQAARMLSRHPKAAFVGGLGRTFGGAYLLQRGLFLPGELPSLLGAEGAQEGLERLRILDLIDSAMTPDPGTDFGRVASLEASLYMRNQLLRDADWASMAHSVEVRTPLVDAMLLRQLAPLLLEHGSKCKKTLAGMLSPWVRGRPKSGFSVPIRAWMGLPDDATSSGMRGWARYVLERSGGGA